MSVEVSLVVLRNFRGEVLIIMDRKGKKNGRKSIYNEGDKTLQFVLDKWCETW